MVRLSDFATPVNNVCSTVDVFALFGALNKEVDDARKKTRKNK